MGAEDINTLSVLLEGGLPRVLEHIRSWSTINLDGSINALHAERIPRYSIEPHWHEEFAVGLIDCAV
jgi:hypothetical protein